jgi:hypothetical protein
MSNAVSDDMMFADGAANAVGSLAVGGVVGKGIKLAGAGLAARVAVGTSGPSRAAFLLQRATNAGAMPLSIGLQEGGGAYQQTVNQVMGMTHEQLMAGSEGYAELIRAGMTPDEARVEVATDAGMQAAAIQAPVGAVTGMLTSKFEANPLKVPSLGSAAANVLKEGVEEGIQSGSGQLAQNYAISENADRNQDMLAGVGEQAGAGALYGMAAAGITQSPGAALQASVSAAKLGARGAVVAGKAAASPIMARIDRLNIANEASSPTSAATMDLAMDDAASFASAPEMQEQTIAAMTKAAAPEAVDEIQAKVSSLFDAVKFNPAEAELEAQTSPAVGAALADSTDRFDAFRRVAAVAIDEAADPADRMDAGFYLLKNVQQFSALTAQVTEAREAVADEDPALDQLYAFEEVAYNIHRHPQIAKAIKETEALVAKINQEQLATSLDTADGQKAVNTAIGVAQFMPDKLSAAVSEKILGYVQAKKLEVTQTQLASLKASNTLAQESAAHAEREQALGLRPRDIVSGQILTDDKSDDSQPKSASAHFRRILAAVNAGDTEGAGETLNDFRKFAQHMQNKVAAFNESLTKGNGQ